MTMWLPRWRVTSNPSRCNARTASGPKREAVYEGMRRNLEGRQQSLASLLQGKLLQIQLRGLAEIADGLGH